MPLQVTTRELRPRSLVYTIDLATPTASRGCGVKFIGPTLEAEVSAEEEEEKEKKKIQQPAAFGVYNVVEFLYIFA